MNAHDPKPALSEAQKREEKRNREVFEEAAYREYFIKSIRFHQSRQFATAGALDKNQFCARDPIKPDDYQRDDVSAMWFGWNLHRTEQEPGRGMSATVLWTELHAALTADGMEVPTKLGANATTWIRDLANDWIKLARKPAKIDRAVAMTAAPIIRALMDKLYQVASEYNDRSCDYDVCKPVRDAQEFLRWEAEPEHARRKSDNTIEAGTGEPVGHGVDGAS